MKKKIFAVLTAVFMVMALIPTIAFAADSVTVRVHYNREDTTGWAVYWWIGANSGSFTGEFNDGVVEFVTDDIDATQLIVAKSDWSDREDGDAKPFNGSDGGDRSVDASKVKDGVLDIYVTVGSTANVYEEPADFIATANESEESPAESDESPATSDESPATSDESPATSEESSDPTPASSDPTTPPTTSNPASGVQGITIAVVAATVAGVVVSAKKSKK